MLPNPDGGANRLTVRPPVEIIFVSGFKTPDYPNSRTRSSIG